MPCPGCVEQSPAICRLCWDGVVTHVSLCGAAKVWRWMGKHSLKHPLPLPARCAAPRRAGPPRPPHAQEAPQEISRRGRVPGRGAWRLAAWHHPPMSVMPGQPGSETQLRGWRPTPGNNPYSFIHTALDGGDTRQQASMPPLWSMPLISRACSQSSISAAHLSHCQALTEQHRLLVKCLEYTILYSHFPPSFTHAHRTFVLHLPCSLVFHAGAPHRPALLDSVHTHPQQPRG